MAERLGANGFTEESLTSTDLNDTFQAVGLFDEYKLRTLIEAGSDITYSSNTTISAGVIKKDVIINTGVTVDFDTSNGFLVCRNLTINGTGKLETDSNGAVGSGTPVATPGVSTDGSKGFNGGSNGGFRDGGGGTEAGSGGASDSLAALTGSNGTAATFGAYVDMRKLLNPMTYYSLDLDDTNTNYILLGSSGGSGSSATGSGGAGGAGGGCLFIYVQGTLTIGASASISSVGEAGATGGSAAGGGAGGSGGFIYIMCASAVSTGTITAAGADGGDGGGSNASSGAGGTGGMVIVFSKTTPNPFTLTVSGGTGGTASGTGNTGDNGAVGDSSYNIILGD